MERNSKNTYSGVELEHLIPTSGRLRDGYSVFRRAYRPSGERKSGMPQDVETWAVKIERGEGGRCP